MQRPPCYHITVKSSRAPTSLEPIPSSSSPEVLARLLADFYLLPPSPLNRLNTLQIPEKMITPSESLERGECNTPARKPTQ